MVVIVVNAMLLEIQYITYSQLQAHVIMIVIYNGVVGAYGNV